MALSPLDLLLITFRELRGNLVRSGLTTLGIFMGVAAVNATLNISSINNAQIQRKLASRDNPYLTLNINPIGETFSSELLKINEKDIIVLQQKVPGISSISTVSTVYASEIQFQGTMVSDAQVVGVSENYQRTTGRTILQGRFFEPADFAQYQPVAIVDQALSDKLFQGEDPLGKGLYAGGTRFTVVGLSETK